MKKITEELEILRKETVTYNVANCFKCNSDDIKIIREKGFNPKNGSKMLTIGGVCNKCGNSIIENKYDNIEYFSKLDSSNLWNYHNDINQIIEREELKLQEIKNHLDDLNKIKIERN